MNSAPREKIRSVVLAFLMLAASVVAVIFRPALPSTDYLNKYDFENILPDRFGAWISINQDASIIVNPQQQESLNRIYVKVLERVYRDSKTGMTIMLSVAYGGAQTKESQIHRPEVCYPAQGFQIERSNQDYIDTPYKKIPVRRLVVKQGQRVEPLSYWIRVGNKVARGWLEQKLFVVQQSMLGEIPTGLLFRVSALESNEELAYEVQNRFVRDLLDGLSSENRSFLIGAQGE